MKYGEGHYIEKGSAKGRRCTQQQRDQAVHLIHLAREDGRGFAAVQRIADHLGYEIESFRQWVKQADIDAGDNAERTRAHTDSRIEASWNSSRDAG